MNSAEDEIPLPSVGVLSEEESAKQVREDICRSATVVKITRLEMRIADLEKQLKQIYDVATGQEQVAFDDTLGMVWIAEYITEQKKIP